MKDFMLFCHEFRTEIDWLIAIGAALAGVGVHQHQKRKKKKAAEAAAFEKTCPPTPTKE
jgi:hypothetical protein